MLLSNSVRRLNKFNLVKCVNKSFGTSVICSKKPFSLVNSSLSNLTSTDEFNKIHRRYNADFGCTCRNYSSNRNNNNDDLNLDDWKRKLPRFDDDYEHIPSVYLVLKNFLATLLIRSFFDQTFNSKEFINGAKKAITVISNLLAAGDFEALQDMVDDDTIDKMRKVVGRFSPEQRQLLSINENEIGWIFPHEIQFITKESADDNKSRFFVEIMVVVHATRGSMELEFSNIFKRPNAEFLDHIEHNYSVANYRFIKEFTKGVEDDWTINHICHAKPSDDYKELEKVDREQ